MTTHAMNLSAGPLPVLDVDAMMQRLPVEARASMVGARKPIADALLRLRREPLTGALVSAVAKSFFPPLQLVATKVYLATRATMSVLTCLVLRRSHLRGRAGPQGFRIWAVAPW